MEKIINTQIFIEEVKTILSSGREDLDYEMTTSSFKSYPFIVTFEGKDIGCIYLFSSPAMRAGLVDIMHFRVYDSNQGRGTWLLKVLCDEADKHNVTLYVFPVSDNDQEAIPLDKLKKWYRTFGFIGDISMEREPRHSVTKYKST